MLIPMENGRNVMTLHTCMYLSINLYANYLFSKFYERKLLCKQRVLIHNSDVSKLPVIFQEIII
jgi:hypothetical protein